MSVKHSDLLFRPQSSGPHMASPGYTSLLTFPTRHTRPTDVAHLQLKLRIFPSQHAALPAFTIHTIVARSKPMFSRSQHPRIRTWGPTLAGLAVVPALPYIFDEPVEHVVDRAWEWIESRTFDNKTYKEGEVGQGG
ncbi:mitochondrial 18 KDa protein-domain-containing protein [Scleroderma yunnanense]